MDHPEFRDRPRANQKALDALRGVPRPYLDHGRVLLLDAMGDDLAVVEAARISYADARPLSDDETLLRYLLRHRHTGPFEMCELKFEICLPIYVDRQFVRHRTASRNEQSGRYTTLSDDYHQTSPDQWRTQSATNKQGSGGAITATWPDSIPREATYTFIDDDGGPELIDSECVVLRSGNRCDPTLTPGAFLSDCEQRAHALLRRVYADRLELGVAREQARKDLPLSAYTRMVWKLDLHNLFHLLRLRLAPDAQEEIRALAAILGEITEALFPLSYRAFRDYALEALTLSGPAVRFIADLAPRLADGGAVDLAARLEAAFPNARERQEVFQQLVRLGLAPPA